MQAILYQGQRTFSFKQLDQQLGASKGESFRRFKRVLTELVEGRDYFHLPAQAHAPFIEQLRVQGLIYPSTQNLVLIVAAVTGKLGITSRQGSE